MHIRQDLKPAHERRSEPFRPEGMLPFGKARTDHMFLMTYQDGEWQDPRIVPYGPLALMPGATVLHYAQTFFEGVKAFRHENGELFSFRPELNATRFNNSARLLRMPQVPVEDQLEAMDTLLDLERSWYPEGQNDASMYIRPFMFGIQDSLGVHPSNQYVFCMFLSPSGPYYPKGFTAPISLLVSEHFHRVPPGGMGKAKAGGHYGNSLLAGDIAHAFGANQVLYVDVTGQYLEEAGAMNHFHVTKDGTIVIPDFTDSILSSITSQTCLELGDRLGRSVVQKTIRLEDFIGSLGNGGIVEAGGLGTAAAVSAVGTYKFLRDNQLTMERLLEVADGHVTKEELDALHWDLTVGTGRIGPVARQLYDLITGIQKGTEPAPEGWLHKVERHQ